MILFLFACLAEDKNDTAYVEYWRLVWEDNFDGEAGSPPNPNNWLHDVGGDGWGNTQLEYNTDRTENVSHRGDGFLQLTAKKEDYQGNAYTSARIKTQGLMSAQNARIEARIKVPSGSGIWPAFWMLGDSFSEVGWPACGELDILELKGEDPYTVYGTAHGPGYSGGDGVGGSVLQAEPFSDDFHVYSIDIDPGHIVWSIDNEVFFKLRTGDIPNGTPWVYDEPFFLLLNIAVGGHFVEPPDETTEFPSRMFVDYVRVYERGP
ncbi:MAG: glycoside hydrolase family 16 protein [Myxococcota bacterium]